MKAFGLTEELPGDPKHWNLVLWRISLPLEPDDGSGHGQVLLKLLYHLSAEATCADRVVRQLHLEQEPLHQDDQGFGLVFRNALNWEGVGREGGDGRVELLGEADIFAVGVLRIQAVGAGFAVMHIGGGPGEILAMPSVDGGPVLLLAFSGAVLQHLALAAGPELRQVVRLLSFPAEHDAVGALVGRWTKSPFSHSRWCQGKSAMDCFTREAVKKILYICFSRTIVLVTAQMC